MFRYLQKSAKGEATSTRNQKKPLREYFRGRKETEEKKKSSSVQQKIGEKNAVWTALDVSSAACLDLQDRESATPMILGQKNSSSVGNLNVNVNPPSSSSCTPTISVASSDEEMSGEEGAAASSSAPSSASSSSSSSSSSSLPSSPSPSPSGSSASSGSASGDEVVEIDSKRFLEEFQVRFGIF